MCVSFFSCIHVCVKLDLTSSTGSGFQNANFVGVSRILFFSSTCYLLHLRMVGHKMYNAMEETSISWIETHFDGEDNLSYTIVVCLVAF